jgi:hypothetical protein
VHAPIAEAQIGLGKQAALHPRSEFEIAFERALLLDREISQAQARQRIGNQSLGLNRIVARFAYSVRSVIHPVQRGVNIVQQLDERSQRNGCIDSRNRGDRDFQALAPLFELFAKIGIADRRHFLGLRFRVSGGLGSRAIRFWHGISLRLLVRD